MFRLADDQDASFWVSFARHERSVDVPVFRCEGQFGLYILALGKQGLCTCFQQRFSHFQQIVEWRELAGRDNLSVLSTRRYKIPDSRVMDKSRCARRGHGLPQKCGLFHVAFDEMHARIGVVGERAGDDDSWESPTRPE